MQIIYNPNEVNEIVLGYVQEKLNLDDSNDFHVNVSEDGSITVLVNEESGEQGEREAQPSGESNTRQKKPRRTKAQIEADNKAEEERRLAAEKAAAGNWELTPTTSAEDAKPSDPAQAGAAGEVIQQEQEDPGTPEPEAETPVDPQPDEPTVAVEEEVQEPEPVVEEKVTAEAPAAETESPKPTVSLFANLRTQRNS